MNKEITLLALALMLALGFTSCSKSDKDDELEPQTPNENTQDPVISKLPEGTFVGWTQGSNPYASYIPSAPDSIVIEKSSNGGYDVTYISTTHGKGTFKNVQVTKNDTAFVFRKPIRVGKNLEETAFVFSQAPDTIAMPNRNPNGGEPVWKDYPAVLEDGYLTTDGQRWEITFDVYCNIRYVHRCIVREGAIGNRRSFDIVKD